ncbi:MAG TPA: glycosyltransferase family 4 protein [Planctomycetota bacterium]|nr:glycosyltransferase family 4 protein [Planctomycetota bacterium]
MNILLISREYPPETAFGGIATFVQLLARGLTAAGHRVVVIAQTFGAEREETDALEPCVRVLRVAVPNAGPVHAMSVSLHLFAQLFARRVARAAAELHATFPFDVLETPDHLAEGLHCLEFARARRIPVVTRLYTPWSLLARMGIELPGADSPSDRAALGSMEEQLLHQSQALTAPSRDLARRVQREYNLSSAIEFIPNPVDTERFRPRPAGAAAGGLSATPALLFVGRLEDRKGCRDLPALWAALRPRHPGLRLTILGPDTPNTGTPGLTMAAWLTAEFARLGCAADLHNRHALPVDPDRMPPAGAVELIPRVSLEDLARVYRAHDILLAPSRYDNSPYTVVEALASGLAVVATNAGGAPEYLGATSSVEPGRYQEGPGGRVVRPGDVAGLRAALEEPAGGWLIDAVALRAVQQAAREQALRLCSPAQVAADTLRLYARAQAMIF